MAAFVVAFALADADAQTSLYWDVNGTATGFGGSGTWDTSTPNWNDSTGTSATTVWTNGNNAFFQGTPGTVTLANGLSANAWTVSAGGYTFTGGELSVGGGNISMSSTSGTTTVNSSVSGSANLEKVGAGILSLTSQNTYTGGTIWGNAAASGGSSAAGIISFGSSSVGSPGSVTSGPLGTGTFTIRNSGSFSGGNYIQSTDGTARTIANSVAFLGSGSTFNTGGTGNLTFAGNVALGTGTRGLSINNSTTTFSGVIANSGAITTSGTGSLVLSGASANTYTGKTLVSSGTLVLNKTAGVTAISSTGATGTDASNTDLQISGGSVRLDASNQVANTTKTALSGGTLNLNGFSEGTAGSGGAGLGALTLSANSTINFGTGSTSILHFAGLGTHTTGTVLQITNWSGVANTGGSGDRLLFTGSVSDFTSRYTQSDVSFNGLTGYQAVEFGEFYEVTAVPEPSTYASGLLTLAAIALVKRRHLRGFIGGRA